MNPKSTTKSEEILYIQVLDGNNLHRLFTSIALVIIRRKEENKHKICGMKMS
jgi:hypothetical protein